MRRGPLIALLAFVALPACVGEPPATPSSDRRAASSRLLVEVGEAVWQFWLE